MGFEINKVLNLKVTSIPAGKDKSINIEALNDDASRQKLYSLLTVCFDKTGKKKGVLEAVEMKALYNEAGGKIDKQKLSKLLSKFKLAIFPYKQDAPQKANKTEQKINVLIGELKSENPAVRGNAALVLGEIGPAAKAAVSALKKIASDHSEDSIVRACASKALRDIERK